MNYVSIGSNKVPINMQQFMLSSAKKLSKLGYNIRTDNVGSSKAMSYAHEKDQIYNAPRGNFPDKAFKLLERLSSKKHSTLSSQAKQVKNLMLLLGSRLNVPADFVVYWDDIDNNTEEVVNIANKLGIVTYNLAVNSEFNDFCRLL